MLTWEGRGSQISLTDSASLKLGYRWNPILHLRNLEFYYTNTWNSIVYLLWRLTFFFISKSCHHNSSASSLKLRNIKQIEMNSRDNT